MRTSNFLIFSVLAMAALVPAWAVVSSQEAAELKSRLTPVGAERAGNAA
jgi:hypothetical protein